MNIKNIGSAALLLMLLALSGCKDILNEEPKGRPTPETFFSTQEDLDMSLIALYDAINESQTHAEHFTPQWQGDDLSTTVKKTKFAEPDRFNVPNTNAGLSYNWVARGAVIRAANLIINGAGKTQTSQDEINMAIGNAKYWRAYSLFYLVRLYGAIPMNLDNVVDDYTRTPSSVEEVYAQIESDLLDAERLLPTKYSVAPRRLFDTDIFITKQAAQATLSAVYMAMAGWPMNKTELYAKAAEKAKLVIDGEKAGANEYMLEPEFKNVYSMGHNYTKETVVGINYSPFVGAWWKDTWMSSCAIFESVGGWSDAFGEIRFWKRFPEGPRKDAVYAPKIRLNDGQLVDWWQLKADGQPHVPEYHPMFTIFAVNVDANNVNIDAPFDYTKPISRHMTNGHRHRLIRYSEVLLWYAEAMGRSGKVDALAMECLNRVRQRAGLAALSGLTPEQLAEAAYDEHGWEVAGYWVAMVTRRADQFRMNRLKDTFAERVGNSPVEIVSGITAKEHIEYTEKSWKESMMYMPYPSADAAKNPNLRR